MRLQAKVALITGGGAGIGRATAKLFAAEGARVVIMGRRKETIRRVVAEIEKAGGVALPAAGSITKEEDVRASVDLAAKRFGRIDILVNNAGISGSGMSVHEMSDEAWQRILDTNLTGVFRMTRAVIPLMVQTGGGSIVNLSSVAGLVNFLADAAYSASKAGVIMFTKSVAVAYAPQQIRCNCVCPAVIQTPMIEPFIEDANVEQAVKEMHPLGRLGTAEEVARAISYLASDEAGFVTGSVLTIDGGVTAQ